MYWWIPALLAPVAQGFATYLDKVGLGRGKTSAFAFLFTLGTALLLLPLFLFIKIDVDLLPIMYIGSLIGSTALYFSFRALKEEDMSLISPLIGSAGPIMTWLVATLVIGDTISLMQFTGILVIVIGGLLLSYGEHLFQKIQSREAIIFAGMAVTLYSFSSTIDKFLMNNGLDVIAYLVVMHWFAVINLGVILTIRHRQDFTYILKNTLEVDWKYLLGVMLLTLTYRALQIYAVSLGPVSLVIAMKRLSLLATVILGGELLHEEHWLKRLIASTIMITGVVLMVI